VNKNGGLSLAQIFTLIEQYKLPLCIETYSLSQTTLEQIFIAFAKSQSQPVDDTANGTVTLNAEN
jgi:hypothetical protein